MPKLEAVLFDLDGTLLDSVHDISQGINMMLVDEGRQALAIEEISPMLGDGAMELCHRALLKTGGVKEDDLFPYVQKFIAHYRAVKPDPNQVFPHAREVLEELKKANIKMGVCTNKADSTMHSVLDALDLSSYFGFMAGGDTFEVHKPNPGHVTGVLDKLGASVKGTVFVGDGPQDVAASSRAGVACLVMTHGYGVNFGDMNPDGQIDGFDELMPAIKKLGFEV